MYIRRRRPASFFIDMARKSTYDPNIDYLKLADEYLSTCGRENTKLPKISQFCREYIKKSQDAVDDWLAKEKDVESLSGAIKKIKEVQMEQLMDDGLYGGKEVNNAMAIFLLKSNHGLIETDRHEFKGDGFLIKLDAGNIIQRTGKVSTETT